MTHSDKERPTKPDVDALSAVIVEVSTGWASHEDGMIVLAFQGSAAGECVKIIVMLEEHPNDRSVAAGTVGPHLEWNDEASSGYDLISSIRWRGPDIEIETTESARMLLIPRRVILSRAAHRLDYAEQSLADMMLETIESALSEGTR